jgi:hypothetical protein
MTAALRRVLGAPGWLASIWLLQIGLAAAAGVIVQATLGAALEPHAATPDGHTLYALADLVLDHRAVLGGTMATVAVTSIAGVLAWTLLVGGVLARLAYGHDTPRVMLTWWRTLPAVLVQSLWHLGIRVGLWLLALSTASALPRAAGWPLLWLVWAVATVGLDLARARVVRGTASAYHPRTAAVAMLDVVRAPGRFAPAFGLAALGALLPAVTLLVAMGSLGAPAMPSLARLVALLAVGLGFWRLAIVLERDPADAD